MSELLEAFKKHFFVSMLAICAVIAGITWKLASEFIERPLKDQIAAAKDQAALADRQASILRDQVGILPRSPTLPLSTNSAVPAQPNSGPVQDPGIASGACAILDAGNKLYTEQKFSDAVAKYLSVQSVDKFGKSACVGAIYATIGTIYTLIGEPLLSSNPAEAAKNYRLANNYNKAFAAAVICKNGDCKLSEDLWAKGF